MSAEVGTLAVGAEEWVDQVDAHNCVVGRVRRREVRARNLWHRASYVLVRNRAGLVFVHQRTSTKDVFPSHYDMMVGGVVGAGEDPACAARREVGEELGVLVSEVRWVTSIRYEDATNRVFGEVYSCFVEGPFRLQPEEIVGGEWLEVEEVCREVRRRPFCPDSVAAFEQWLERQQRDGACR